MNRRGARPLRAWIALVAWGLAGAALAADLGADESRALRRTPAVEVFAQWKDAVVFVTGPRVKGDKPTTEEFFLPPPGPEENSVGTGFVIHESGYVLTNAHAAERLIQPRIALADGRVLSGELVANNHAQDVALLKIEAGRPLKAVRLAAADDLLVGETVIVIANPHGLLRTCTVGVLSAVGRNSAILDVRGLTLQNLIQSDAGINPGSSGGPWFNAAGDVIGMTTSMKRDAENIAFAIPAATLRRALPEMLDAERRYGLDTGLEVAADGPCEVIRVRPDSPAAEAGLQAGDVITQLGDRPIAASAAFHLALVGHKPGNQLSLRVQRQGAQKRGTITLGLRAKPDAAGLLRQKLGLTAAPLTPARVRAMNLRSDRGVVVTEADPQLYEKVSPQPQPGDVLARIGYIRPRDLEQVGLLLEKTQPKQTLSIVLLRKEGSRVTRINMDVVLSR